MKQAMTVRGVGIGLLDHSSARSFLIIGSPDFSDIRMMTAQQASKYEMTLFESDN
jgi:hypothetical protein